MVPGNTGSLPLPGGSMDDIESPLLDAKAQAAGEYALNNKQERLLEYIRQNIPVSGFLDVLSEDMWLREVLKDVDSKVPSVRGNALRMWGQYQGFLHSKGAKPGPRKVIEFED